MEQEAQAIHADVASPSDAQKATQATVEAFGHLDILVNNAAVYPFASVLQMSEKVWDEVFNVSLRGLFFYSQAAAQEMVKAGHGGKIINMTSMEALHPTGVDLAHYDAAKGEVLTLTKALALELAPHNILVNAVAPGAVMTPGQYSTGGCPPGPGGNPSRNSPKTSWHASPCAAWESLTTSPRWSSSWPAQPQTT